jgi:uncharacterized membrane protein
MKTQNLPALAEELRAKLRQPRLRLLALLLAGSSIGVFLLALRSVLGWQLAHLYLVWNLFLAWVPLGFALLAHRYGHSRWRVGLCGICWLLFFPNAPHLMTDLVHLRPRPPVPLWADILLLQLFIWLGMLLGFVSLVEMQRLVNRRLGARASWWFVPLALALAGFGVYLGRFARWNSWDVLTSPLGLWRDIAARLMEPAAHPRTVGFSLLCFLVLLTAYLILYALMRVGAEVSSESDSPLTADSYAEGTAASPPPLHRAADGP